MERGRELQKQRKEEKASPSEEQRARERIS